MDMTTYAVLFEFDAATKEDKRVEVAWTGRQLEEGVDTAEHGILKERTYRVEGVVTAWPLIGVTARNPQRVVQAEAALEALAEAKRPLTLITEWWTPTVVIKTVSSSSGAGEGEALRIALEVTTITLAKPVYTTIPASRLKPAVRKRNAPPAPGGAAAGKKKPATTPKVTSWLGKVIGL